MIPISACYTSGRGNSLNRALFGLRPLHYNDPREIRDIDQKGAIGNHEFNLTPISLFSPDGSMLRCTDNAKLIRLLELLGHEAELEQGRLPSG